MQQLAQAWLVLEISHSARLLGLDAFQLIFRFSYFRWWAESWRTA
jgi:hypothetical protein